MNTRTLVLVVAALLLPLPALAADPVFSGFETQITADPGDQYDPAIAGNLVVFTDDRSGDLDVYYVDLDSMTEHPVIVAPGDQELTGVSGGVIVYTDYRSVDVMAFTAADGTTQDLTQADKTAAGRGFNSVDPAISSGLVAWEDDRDGNQEIYARLLSTGEERRVTNSPDVDERPAVSGNLIVWQRCPLAGGACDIWMYDWSSGITTQITNTPDDEQMPAIDGRHIVYQATRNGEQDIYLYDLDTKTEKQLSLPGAQANPHISGDYVAMDDLSEGIYHIKLWHHPSGSVFQVTSGTSGQYLNDIDGSRVVYTDDRNGDLDIYMFTFSVVFPPPTPTEVCRSATLSASATYAPDRSQDGSAVFAPAMQFALPAQLAVTAGNAGNHFAALTFAKGWDVVSCKYRGGAKSSHPTGSDAAAGLSYAFVSCSDGSAAGALVTTDQVWLHLDGDCKAGETTVSLTLAEASPCVGALPPDCQHLQGAAPIIDVTLTAETRHHHCGGGGDGDEGSTFVATPMNALVCIDNGPNGTSITTGTLELDEVQLVGPGGWLPQIEAHADLGAVNSLESSGLAPGGATVRVRVFAGPATTLPPPSGWNHHGGWGWGWGWGHRDHEKLGGGSGGGAGGGAEASADQLVGCSQAGSGLAPLALLAMLFFALLPRQTLARVRARRR